MFERPSIKYGRSITIIHPGELYASDKDELIGTLLGSCVALCLYDEEAHIAGMNHFMLSGRITKKDVFSDESAKYGINAIKKLLKLMIQKGADRSRIKAKIFGGGHVLSIPEMSWAIPDDNVRLARAMMELEDIHIVKSDVGGGYTRKIMMDVQNGKVYLKRSTREEVIQELEIRDSEYVLRRKSHGKD